MIPNKNFFVGSAGKLRNIGGSRMYTIPHTINVPVEYEITTSTNGVFLTCSLDCRLWLFSDSIIALKWNESNSKMEVATSSQVSVEKVISRGIDWILTDDTFFQVLDDSPYLFSETVSLSENFSVDAFYSFLPPVSSWQIVKNFLIKRYDNNSSASVYPLSIPNYLFLTHKNDVVWGIDSSYIGAVSIIQDENDNYTLDITHDYSLTSTSSMGLAFLGDKLYGFRPTQEFSDTQFCLVSADTQLYSVDKGTWQNVFDDSEGQIFFDAFNYSAVAVRDNDVAILPENKIFSANGIAQWFAPTRNIAAATNNFVIAQVDHDILAVHVNSGLYREFLRLKNLPLSSREYSGQKLSIGARNNLLEVNKVIMQEATPSGRFIKLLTRPIDTWDKDYDFSRNEIAYYRAEDGWEYMKYQYIFGYHYTSDLPVFFTSFDTIEKEKAFYDYDTYGYVETDDFEGVGGYWAKTLICDENYKYMTYDSWYEDIDEYSYHTFYSYYGDQFIDTTKIRGRYYYIDIDQKSLIYKDIIINIADIYDFTSRVMLENIQGHAEGYTYDEYAGFRVENNQICLYSRGRYLIIDNGFFLDPYEDPYNYDYDFVTKYTTTPLETLPSCYQSSSSWQKISKSNISLLRIFTPDNSNSKAAEFKDIDSNEVFSISLDTTEDLPYQSYKTFSYLNNSTGEIIHVVFLVNKSMIKHILILSNRNF